MPKKFNKTILQLLRPKLVLFGCMTLIGGFTVFASANTYEVVARHDVSFSSVITTISLTKDARFDRALKQLSDTIYFDGKFGVPKKIKLPETKQHIDITEATYGRNGWLASKGLGQTFTTAEPRQKVFGEAVIYLRYNTATTQHLGEVLNEDIVNIVTTEGWQFGYQVYQTTADPTTLDRNKHKDTSTIMVIMVDDNTGSIKSFAASLVKVGERI